MKLSIRTLSAAALLGAAVSLAPVAAAQETVTQVSQSTTSSDGTVTEFSPTGDTVVLRTEASTEPVRYSYSKQTTIVDQDGNPVDVSVIKSGVPVQVFYDHDGDHMVARRIVVHRTVSAPADPGVIVKKTTTTTTTTNPQ